MLRITVSKGGQSAVNYFKEALSRQDYYAEKSTVMGTWHGKTANRLGLGHEVSQEEFERLVKNRHPLSGDKLTVRDNPNRRAGYDFTFNAPKSVSIVDALTNDTSIRDAHHEAIQKAMQEVEANMQYQAGQGKDKHYKTSGNLIFAAFEHDVTRPVEKTIDGEQVFIPDPHLHTHCFVMNATWNENRTRFQAIEIGNIKKNGAYYEALYHNALALELEKAGYQIERTKQSFEIKGIPRETIEKFSCRTHEIELAAKAKGLSWAKDKAQLGIKTRHNKNKSVSETDMRASWQDRLDLQEDFNLQALKDAPLTGKSLAGEKEKDRLSYKEALDRALNHYMERKSAVPEKQVLAYALKLGVDHFDPDRLEAELATRKGDTVFSGHKKSDTYITTKKAIMAEDRMKNFVSSTRASMAAINPDYEPQQPFLNDGQRNAINHALSSQDQVVLIAGGAGVGKTTLMKEVQHGVEESGKRLFAFAPSADASRGALRSKGFQDANTIKKLLDDQKLQDQLKDQVILIDEAGMVGNQTMNSIFKIAEEKNARVILSGDWKQHNSVEAGDALRLLEQDTELPVARVNEIVRQDDKHGYKQAVTDLADGRMESAFDRLDQMNSIIEIEEVEERHKQIASDYLASVKAPKVREHNGQSVPRTAIVVTPTHREGQAISGVIRSKLRQEGLVKGQDRQFQVLHNLSLTEADKQDHLNYQSGQRIQFHQTVGPYKAGSSYDVAQIDKNGAIHLQGHNKNQPTPLPVSESHAFQVYRKEQINLAEGDLIRVTGNGFTEANTPLNNGDGYKVKGFTPKGDIILDNGETMSKEYQNFTLGYYRTSHSSQGKDAHDVLIAQSSLSFGASNEKQFYVSVSRGIERCRIYTDDKQGLKWAASQKADRMSADEIAQSTKEQSAWLRARNEFHCNRQVDLARDTTQLTSKTKSETMKDRSYESTRAHTRTEEPQITDFEI
ncbi:MAG: MobF family relaxase [Bacteroidota bacterium]